MGRVKVWLAVIGIGVILGCGALFAFTQGIGDSKSTANPAPSTAHPAAPSKPVSAADATQLIQGILAQVQQAASTPTGPKALTPAEAKAIVDEQTKKFGITPK